MSTFPDPTLRLPEIEGTYQASKPQIPRLRGAWRVMAAVITPLIVLWKAFLFLPRALLGRLLRSMILPALWLKECQEGFSLQKHLTAREKASGRFRTLNISTHDKADLATVEIAPRRLSGASRKYLVCFNPNAAAVRGMLPFLKAYAEAIPDLTVVGFDYRGVGGSRGTRRPITHHDLVTDGIAQVQRLLDQGVAPRAIILYGYSLGGAIGILVAKHFHDLGKPVKIYNDRSFSSISQVVMGWIRRLGQPLHHEPVFLKIVGWICKPFLKGCLMLGGWEIDVARAFAALPLERKRCIVVRSDKNDRRAQDVQQRPQDDQAITHVGSLYHALSKKEKRRVGVKVVAWKASDEGSTSAVSPPAEGVAVSPPLLGVPRRMVRFLGNVHVCRPSALFTRARRAPEATYRRAHLPLLEVFRDFVPDVEPVQSRLR